MTTTNTATAPAPSAVRYTAGGGGGITPGRYSAEIIGVEPGVSQAGKPKLVVSLALEKNGVKLGRISDHLSLTGHSRTDQFFATACQLEPGRDVEVLTSNGRLSQQMLDLAGRRFLVDVTLQDSTKTPGRKYASISRYYPAMN